VAQQPDKHTSKNIKHDRATLDGWVMSCDPARKHDLEVVNIIMDLY